MPQITVQISGPSSDDYQLPSDGYHIAALADIIDFGKQAGPYGIKDEMLLVWLLDEAQESNGEPLQQIQFVSKSLFKSAEKTSTLRLVVEAIQGELTQQQIDNDEVVLEKLIGQSAKLLTEVRANTKGKERSKILSVKSAPANKGVAIPRSFVRDYQKPVGDRWAAKLGKTVLPSSPAPKAQAPLGGRAAAAAVLAPAKSTVTYDDIPF